jgi:molybdopterin-guanine dinucleotide biosynthesis protein A
LSHPLFYWCPGAKGRSRPTQGGRVKWEKAPSRRRQGGRVQWRKDTGLQQRVDENSARNEDGNNLEGLSRRAHQAQRSGSSKLGLEQAMTGLIMAGGKSRRLGQDKRFLILGGKSCLQRVLDVYKNLFEEIVIVADEKEPFQSLGIRVVEDMIPGRATLGGLYTGLHHAGSDRVFAAAVDMPSLSTEAIRIVLEQSGQADIVIPDLNGKLQPMHAAYSKACLPYLKELIDASRLKVQELCAIPELSVHRIPQSVFKRVDPELRSFFNINTPEDLARARKWIEG